MALKVEIGTRDVSQEFRRRGESELKSEVEVKASFQISLLGLGFCKDMLANRSPELWLIWAF